MAIAVRRSFGIEPAAMAAASRGALDVAIEEEAELWIARPGRAAMVLGAFERRSPGTEPTELVVRRGSGGPAVRVGEGTLWLALVLPRVDALVACDEGRIVNRYVRPLLKALTRAGAMAHFFGRDWVSVKHRPAAWIGFAHDRGSGRAVVEAFVARATRFDRGERGAYLGKEPGTLAEIVGREVDERGLADGIVAAYAEAYGRVAIDRGEIAVAPGEGAAEVTAEPPWRAVTEEAIGLIGAGPDAGGRFRIGGELLVSRDALGALEHAAAGVDDAGVGDEEVDRVVDATLGAPGVALDGVRSLASVRDVIVAARRS